MRTKITRSDLDLEIARLDYGDDTAKAKVNRDDLIHTMYQKIENVYKILFALEQFGETEGKVFRHVAKLLREALES